MFSTEYKRSRQEIKRKSLDTIKLQKKARKGEKIFEELVDKWTSDETLWTFNADINEVCLAAGPWSVPIFEIELVPSRVQS